MSARTQKAWRGSASLPDFFGSDTDIAALHARLPDSGGAERAHLLATLAWYSRQRDSSRAQFLADEARGCLDAIEDADERIRAEARLALACWEGRVLRGECADAQAADSARRQFESIGDFAGVGDAWALQADHARHLETPRAPQARAAAREAYARCSDTARQCLVAVDLILAAAFTDPAAVDEPAHRAVLAAASTHEHQGIQARAAAVLGTCHSMSSDFAGSIAHWQRAHELWLASGQVRAAISAARNLSSAYASLSDFDDGLAWAERALDLARRAAWPLWIGAALTQMANLLQALKRHADAAPLVEEATALLGRFRDSSNWADACRVRADGELALDDHGEALRWAVASEEASERLGMRQFLASALVVKARALSRLGRPAEAAVAAEHALGIAGNNRFHDVKGHALWTMAEIARVHGLPLPERSAARSAPIHYLEAAVRAMQEIGNLASIPPDWLSDLSRDHEAAGDLARALECQRQSGMAFEALHDRQTAGLAAAMQARYQTERARAEAAHNKALAEAEAAANRAKSAFLSSMSHELRSPLNAMLGFTRLLLHDRRLDAHHADLSIVMRSGEHLHALINQVLDISKIEAGRTTLDETEFDLHLLLQELQDLFAATARDKGITLELRLDPALPRHVRLDALKLRQVLINLLGNALKFTPRGAVELRALVAQGRLAFAVSDTGAGIAPEELALLGRPFVQSHTGRRAAEGTGLGLAISRGFVQIMGGELRLSSVQGQGTQARFDVPLHAVDAAAVASRRTATSRRAIALAPGTPAQRVVVADDRPEGRMLVKRLLMPLGFQVREAGDGEQAVAVWREWAPQLVLMDMRMPVMDGREATRRIKASPAGRATIVIALTASSFEDERMRILAAGCDDFVRKPFEEEALLECIAGHLKIGYVYEEGANRAPAAHPDAAKLGLLPEALKAELRAALDRLDVAAVERGIDAVRAMDQACAAALEPLARRFEYERIRALL